MRILRLDALRQKVGLSRSAIYQMVSQHRFPKPISLGPRAVGWLESDIDKWIQGRMSSSGQETAAA